MLGIETYQYSYEALVNCQISFIATSKFNKILKKIPKLNQLLIQHMNYGKGVIFNLIATLGQKNVVRNSRVRRITVYMEVHHHLTNVGYKKLLIFEELQCFFALLSDFYREIR